MTTDVELPSLQTELIDVAGMEIFLAATEDGPPLLLLHGGGPGASGVSNYACNIAELAKNYRVLVPDLPGYGRSTKGLDLADPFDSLADGIRGLMDRLHLDKAHLVGNSYGGSLRSAARPGHPRPRRPDGPDGPWRHRYHPGTAHAGPQLPARLLQGGRAVAGEAGESHPAVPRLQRRRRTRRRHRSALPGQHRPGGRCGPAAEAPESPGAL
ncbi:alpha/beta fold hydrolase [Streptomyces canus]|uniref:alpha/beta fold hydrolase n=1 Tax=Streptomyces canus TaxID=58343 RepID=UPI0036BE0445